MSHITGSSEWMLHGPLTAAIIGTWMSSMLRWRWRPPHPALVEPLGVRAR